MLKYINEDFSKLKEYGFTNNWSGTKNWCANFGNTYVEIDIQTREIKVTVDADYENSTNIDELGMEKLCDFFNSNLLAKVKKACEWSDSEIENMLYSEWLSDLISWEKDEEGNIKVITYSEDYTIGKDEEKWWVYVNQRRIRKH